MRGAAQLAVREGELAISAPSGALRSPTRRAASPTRHPSAGRYKAAHDLCASSVRLLVMPTADRSVAAITRGPASDEVSLAPSIIPSVVMAAQVAKWVASPLAGLCRAKAPPTPPAPVGRPVAPSLPPAAALRTASCAPTTCTRRARDDTRALGDIPRRVLTPPPARRGQLRAVLRRGVPCTCQLAVAPQTNFCVRPC